MCVTETGLVQSPRVFVEFSLEVDMSPSGQVGITVCFYCLHLLAYNYNYLKCYKHVTFHLVSDISQLMDHM